MRITDLYFLQTVTSRGQQDHLTKDDRESGKNEEIYIFASVCSTLAGVSINHVDRGALWYEPDGN